MSGRAYNNRAWKNLRPIVLERDNYRCQECGGDIDRNPRNYTEPNAGVADHKTPVSRGGPNELWNLRAIHVKCNQQRGDKPLPKTYPATPRR